VCDLKYVYHELPITFIHIIENVINMFFDKRDMRTRAHAIRGTRPS